MAKSQLELASCPTPESIDKYVQVLKAEFKHARIIGAKISEIKSKEPENTGNAETKKEKKAEAKAARIAAKAAAACVRIGIGNDTCRCAEQGKG